MDLGQQQKKGRPTLSLLRAEKWRNRPVARSRVMDDMIGLSTDKGQKSSRREKRHSTSSHPYPGRSMTDQKLNLNSRLAVLAPEYER